MNIKYDPTAKQWNVNVTLPHTKPEPPPSEFDQTLERLRTLYNQLDDEWGETVSDKEQLLQNITRLEKQVHDLRTERNDIRIWAYLWGISSFLLFSLQIAMFLAKHYPPAPEDIPARPVPAVSTHVSPSPIIDL